MILHFHTTHWHYLEVLGDSLGNHCQYIRISNSGAVTNQICPVMTMMLHYIINIMLTSHTSVQEVINISVYTTNENN